VDAGYRRCVATSSENPPPQLRAQLLSTEHWSLLSARSTIQGELLTRITIFLTLVSAGLVSIALIGNATNFAEPFPAIAVVILAFEVAVGVLTQLRVFNAALDDLVLVLGMNRVRAGYVELDPGLERFLVTSARDDPAGIDATYYPAGRTPARSHVAASSMTLIVVVNAALVGTLAAAICVATSLPVIAAIVVGVVLGTGYLIWGFVNGYREYIGFLHHYRPSFPTPE
jgi:hypothetical protein